VRTVSTSLARQNLHLVIPQGGTQPLYLRYLVVNGGDSTLVKGLRQVRKKVVGNWLKIGNVPVICPQIRETGASHIWHDDPFACSAFVLFDPGQQTLLHQEIIKQEGWIHSSIPLNAKTLKVLETFRVYFSMPPPVPCAAEF
jgi:hypothetical protein